MMVQGDERAAGDPVARELSCEILDRFRETAIRAERRAGGHQVCGPRHGKNPREEDEDSEQSSGLTPWDFPFSHPCEEQKRGQDDETMQVPLPDVILSKNEDGHEEPGEGQRTLHARDPRTQ